MGIIIGKFRKKKSTYDILEKLEEQIKSIEEYGKDTQLTRKRIVGRFLVLAFLLYIALIIISYYNFNEVSENAKLHFLLSIMAIPFVIILMKRLLTWYYNRKLLKNEKKLVKLKEEKTKILDQVMETETYKVAKKILEKFGNEKKFGSSLELTPVSSTTSTTLLNRSAQPLASSRPALRQRVNVMPPSKGRLSFGSVGTPVQNTPLLPSRTPARPLGPYTTMPATPMQLPRNILPRDRSVFDKMVDYLVGDGPSNRYALICKQCSSHNGMALKEEFEFLSFKCCYCQAFNPSLKKKPVAPKLESDSSPTRMISNVDDSTSDSEKNSSSDTDSDEKSKPIITELRPDSPDGSKLSDFDKLSDLEQKNSDTESSPIEIDTSKNLSETVNEEIASRIEELNTKD